MRYVPNLIPEKSKVMADYFKGNLYEETRKNIFLHILSWTLAVSFLLYGFISIKHPALFLLYGAIAFILVPPGHQFIERKLRFRLTTRIKAVACCILMIASLPLAAIYRDTDKHAVSQQKKVDEKAANEKAIAEQIHQQKKDSLNYYIQKSNQLTNQHKIEAANEQLTKASLFAVNPADKNLIEKQKNNIAFVRMIDLMKGEKYKIALPEINNLLASDPSNAELRYRRAVCYSKTGEIRDAVIDLKPLIESGNKDAERLYERINPIKKRIVGYETLCCDGTTSNATGRGACSHHGGVCDWNNPIYEEYRKYE